MWYVVSQQQKVQLIFIGTSEHMDEFDAFETKPFVSCFLGNSCPLLSMVWKKFLMAIWWHSPFLMICMDFTLYAKVCKWVAFTKYFI